MWVDRKNLPPEKEERIGEERIWEERKGREGVVASGCAFGEKVTAINTSTHQQWSNAEETKFTKSDAVEVHLMCIPSLAGLQGCTETTNAQGFSFSFTRRSIARM